MKVGDDNVLWDPEDLFAQVYESIGVPINTAKTKYFTQHGSFIEFVSRNSWNNHDYSVISPGLVSKYIRNDFYLPVLYNHIVQRDTNPPSISEFIDYKKELKSLKENFSLERFEASRKILMEIMSIMQVATQKRLLDDFEMVQVQNQKLILLAKNLVLATLAEFVRLTELQLTDKKGAISEESINLLSGEFKLLPKIDNYLYGSKDFFSKVVSENYTFKEVILLWQALPITSSITRNLESGIEKITDFPIHDPFISTETGSLVLNPEFINFFMNLEWKLRNQMQVHRTLQRGPNFTKDRPISIVESYKFLNRIIRTDVEILDIESGYYHNYQGNQEEKLNPSLVAGYSILLKTKDYLKLIDNHIDQRMCLYEEPQVPDSNR
jgi:hypothetical protein